MTAWKWIACAALVATSGTAFAQVSVRDDMGRSVQLKKRPERIVTLAPFLTELARPQGPRQPQPSTPQRPSQYGM